MISLENFLEYCRALEKDIFGIIAFTMALLVIAIITEALFQILENRNS